MKRTMMIAGALVLALGLAACGPYQLSAEERQTAELGARDRADRSQADYVGCSGQDSDKDGYVTCSTKSRIAPHAESEMLCSYRSRGCKAKT